MLNLNFLTVLVCLTAVSNADTITVCLDGSCDYSDIQEGDMIECFELREVARTLD